MINLYNKVSVACSKVLTNAYSTSFSSGINCLAKEVHDPVYAIYGFVRVADEIVDTFYGFNQAELFDQFKKDTYQSIEKGISLNPILQAFQEVVNTYKIPLEYIEAFFYSMEVDLSKKDYDQSEYEKYIYGSAEVVGLMCLKVFCKGDNQTFEQLKGEACALGSAFQKINFLRDIKSDFEERGRIYFPGLDYENFMESDKRLIEQDIEKDFKKGLEGIQKLPQNAKKGVMLAYNYYVCLLEKVKKASVEDLKQNRIRVPNWQKLYIYIRLFI